MSVVEKTKTGLALYGNVGQTQPSKSTSPATTVFQRTVYPTGASPRPPGTSKSKKPLAGSVTEVSIQGGSLSARSLATHEESKTETKKVESATAPPLRRAGTAPGFAYTTVSSRKKDVGDKQTPVPPIAAKREPPKKRPTGILRMRSMPGSDSPVPIIRGGSKPITPHVETTAVEPRSMTPPPSSSKLAAPSQLPPPQLQTPPSDLEQNFRATLETAKQRYQNTKLILSRNGTESDEEEDSPATPPLADPSSKPDVRETKSASTTPRKRVSFSNKLVDEAFSLSQGVPEKYGSGKFGEHTLKMMQAALRGADYDVPSEIMDTPDLTGDAQAHSMQIPTPRIVLDTLNSSVINLLFPSDNPAPKKTVRLDFDTEIELDTINASAGEIQNLALTEEEVETVKRLSFFHSDISDEQLMAIIGRFPHVEEVLISICPEVTDAAICTLSTLKKLKSVSIRYCHLVTDKGLKTLPLENLEEFGLSTHTPIEAGIVKRLAQSPFLRKLDFNLCSQLTPEVLLCLKDAKNLQMISIKGCDQIDQDTIDELNKNRGDKPIHVKMGVAEQSDRSTSGLPRILEIPPHLPESPDILSMAAFPHLFENRNPNALPSRDFIEEFNFSKKIKDFKGFNGVSLSGSVPSDSLIALIKRFPEMEFVRIYNSPDFNYSGILSLRQLTKAKVLYLGKLPGITENYLKLMFSKSWQELREVHLSGMPVSDEILQLLSTLPNLERVTISGCDRFTVQGLQALMRGCKSLKYLSIADCPSIDAFAINEFRSVRSDVQLKADKTSDESTIRAAFEEASRRIFDPTITRHFVFLRGLIQTKDPIPETAKIDFDKEKITKFYLEQLALLGVDSSVNEKQELQKQWMHFDQILQAYLNISRAAWGLRKELFRVGFFTNQDREKPPQTVVDIILLLKGQSRAGINPYIKKIQYFDFSGLTYLPYFILDELKWPQLRKIKLEETSIMQLSDFFKWNCPMLKLIEYPDRKEALEAPPSPITKHLPPPPEMEDSKEDPAPPLELQPKKGRFDFLIPSFMKKKKQS